MEKVQKIQGTHGSLAPREPFKYAGFLAAIGASAFGSAGFLVLKLLPVDDTIQEKAKASMIRGALTMLFCGILSRYRGESLTVPRSELAINISRATTGGFGVLCCLSAINYITIGECSALLYSSTIWTCILCWLLLKEPLKSTMVLAIPCGFLGLILLADPDLLLGQSEAVPVGTNLFANRTEHLFAERQNLTIQARLAESDNVVGTVDVLLDATNESGARMPLGLRLMGIVLGILGSLFTSGSIIALKLRRETPIATCTFYFGVAICVVSIGVQMVIGFGAMPRTLLECFIHICISLISCCNQILNQWSLQFVPASIFSIMRCLDVLLCFLLGALFLDDAIPWTSAAGAVLIVIVVVALILEDRLKEFLRCCPSGESSEHRTTLCNNQANKLG